LFRSPEVDHEIVGDPEKPIPHALRREVLGGTMEQAEKGFLNDVFEIFNRKPLLTQSGNKRRTKHQIEIGEILFGAWFRADSTRLGTFSSYDRNVRTSGLEERCGFCGDR